MHAGHAKKVELEYLADLQLCARCLIYARGVGMAVKVGEGRTLCPLKAGDRR